MHQYLENVRLEIEAAAGQESYLASSLFYRLYTELPYEDDGAKALVDTEGYEAVRNKVVNILSKKEEFSIRQEVLSWQAGVLRHMARDFHHLWVDYKEDHFSADDFFSDGETCIALEASCDRIHEDPTENYTAILEVERSLAKLATCPNSLTVELDRFWSFKAGLLSQGEGISSFAEKRIQVERSNTLLAAILRTMEEVSARCNRNARQLAGAHHLLWGNAHHLLEGCLQALRSFLEFEQLENLELSLSHWLDQLFPKKLNRNLPNPLYMSSTHQEVIARLTQATQCMVQLIAYGNDAFAQRDQILIPHFIDALERVKKLSLKNIQALKEEKKGQAQL